METGREFTNTYPTPRSELGGLISSSESFNSRNGNGSNIFTCPEQGCLESANMVESVSDGLFDSEASMFATGSQKGSMLQLILGPGVTVVFALFFSGAGLCSLPTVQASEILTS